MNKSLLFILSFLFFTFEVASQIPAKKAKLNPEDGRIVLENTFIDESMITNQRELDQLPGFPFGQPANPTFKNQRGVTLADINGDGFPEILVGMDKTLYCITGDGQVLWQRQMDGIIVLPPTTGDMNNNDSLEIAVNNAGLAALGAAGKVYLLDSYGQDLEGWPRNFDDHWMMNAPVMADIDGDGIMEIITAERVSGTVGYIHALKIDGSHVEGWPVQTTGNVAFTPSVGDINNDGTKEIVAGLSANGSLYAYDAQGNIVEGFPQIPNNGKLSYQSVILADITGNGNLEIIGSRHGDEPEYYAVDATGNYVEGWPVAASGWTYSPPAVVDINGDGNYQIFMGNPNTDGSDDPQPMDVIFGFDANGSDLPNFPIAKLGGNEGVITVADIDNNGVPDLIFTSNTFTIDDKRGFVHAFATDGSGELEGFPLRTPGMTYMNSAVLGDINADGNLDLVTLSYTSTFGQGIDSVFVSAFDLGYPYLPQNFYFNGYKGSNVRDGMLKKWYGVSAPKEEVGQLNIFPNPTSGWVQIEIPESITKATITVFDITGKKMMEKNINDFQNYHAILQTNQLSSGVYVIYLKGDTTHFVSKMVIE